VAEPTPSRENELAITLRDALAAAFAVHLSRSQGARDFARRVGLDKSPDGRSGA
jgi:hypothetical protein